MCISLFVYDLHPTLLLLLTFNRDEFWDRPTQPAHFWPDEPTVLAGRDALRQGTWLGLTRNGRFALLTNYREPISATDPDKFVMTTTAPSRGALTTDFLTGSMPPLEYLQGLDCHDYNGFNLLVGDLQARQVAYVSNRGPEPRLLQPGSYGVSNGLLQEWPKVQKGLAALLQCLDMAPPAAAAAAAVDSSPAPSHSQARSQAAASDGNSNNSDSNSKPDSSAHLAATAAATAGEDGCAAVGCAAAAAVAAVAAAAAAAGDSERDCCDADVPADCGLDGSGDVPWRAVFKRVMGDTGKVGPGEQLPLTGVGEELDRTLSSVFVEPFEIQPGHKYGTRSQTIIAVWRDGRVEQRERYIEKLEGQEDEWDWKEVRHVFDMVNSTTAEREQQQQQQQQQQQWHQSCQEQQQQQQCQQQQQQQWCQQQQ